MKNSEDKIRRKENLLAWGIYFLGTIICLYPFFDNTWSKLLGASVLISFFLSMINRIIINLHLQTKKYERNKT